MVFSAHEGGSARLPPFTLSTPSIREIPPPSSLPQQNYWENATWSRIHEHTILLRFLSIILRFLRHEVSVYNVYITNQFQTCFARGGDSLDFFATYVQEFGLCTFTCCPSPLLSVRKQWNIEKVSRSVIAKCTVHTISKAVLKQLENHT